MALLSGNGTRYGGCPVRAFSGVTTYLGAGWSARKEAFHDNTGGHGNFADGWHAVADVTSKAGIPNGLRPPYCWHLPRVAGALASRNLATVAVSGAADGAMGVNSPAVGWATVAAYGVGGLIAGGVAAAVISIDGAGDIFAGIGTSALASISVDGSAAIGAIGHVTAEGTLAISGTLVPYARGHMTASSDFGTELTPNSLAAAVWNAAAADFDAAGSMGEKLNDAGSAANPWTEVLEAGLTAGDFMRLFLAVLAGDATFAENGDVIYKAVDGTTTRISGTTIAGVRTILSRNAS